MCVSKIDRTSENTTVVLCRFGIFLSLALYFPILLAEEVLPEPSVSELRSQQHTFALTPYPPYFVPKDAAVIEGTAGHSIQQILNNAQLNVVFRVVNYAGAKQAMREGKFAFANWGNDPETRNDFYSPLPEVNMGLAVYAAAGTDTVPKNIKELAGKNIIVIEGWPLMDFEALIYDKPKVSNIFGVTSVRSAINMLKKGRGDHVIVLRDPVDQLPPSLTKGLKFRVLQVIKGYFLVIPKRYPGSKRLKGMIEDSYHDLIMRKVIHPLETYRTKNSNMMVEVIE